MREHEIDCIMKLVRRSKTYKEWELLVDNLITKFGFQAFYLYSHSQEHIFVCCVGHNHRAAAPGGCVNLTTGLILRNWFMKLSELNQ